MAEWSIATDCKSVALRATLVQIQLGAQKSIEYLTKSATGEPWQIFCIKSRPPPALLYSPKGHTVNLSPHWLRSIQIQLGAQNYIRLPHESATREPWRIFCVSNHENVLIKVDVFNLLV